MRRQPQLREEQLTQVFRALAEEHLEMRRSTAEQTWRRITQLKNARDAGLRPAPPPRSSGRRWLWALVPAGALAAAALFVFQQGDPVRALDYRLIGGTSQGELITTDAKPAKLLFNDDSSIEAAVNTTLNVHVIDGNHLQARLTRGKLKVHVVPREGTDWRFLAGPYEVQVVGTRFDLSWDPESARLALVLDEGRVLVNGPGRQPQLVSAGQVLIVDEQQSAVAVQDTAPEVAVEPASPPQTPSPRPDTNQQGRAPLGWAQRVAAGQFDEVVQEARKGGIDQALAQRSASELQALAQAARYSGNTDLSVQTWLAIRKRFGGHNAGPQAAFFLGRIYDQLGQSQKALDWFDTYLREAPSGVYASETLGRKLTLVRASGDDAQMRKVARSYLTRFPHGPYADTARDILLNE